MSVGILETLLLTDGGIRIWYANASIKETYLQNLSQHGMRRIEVGITVSVKADVAETRKALEDAIEPFQVAQSPGLCSGSGMFKTRVLGCVLGAWFWRAVAGALEHFSLDEKAVVWCAVEDRELRDAGQEMGGCIIRSRGG